MEQQTVRDASERIDALLDELGQSTMPAVMERIEELLQCVLALHGAGLARIIERLTPAELRALADDDLVGNLLVLHDLHPDDVDTRVQRALDQVRPSLGSHGDGFSVSGVDESGVVHLRVESSGDGCQSTAVTVRNVVEDAILAAAPDVVAVQAEGTVSSGPALLQIQPFRPHEAPATGGSVVA